MTTADPKIEALIARAREFVAAPNVHFHYKDGAEVMAGLADALSSLPAQGVACWLELREPNCVPERKGPFPQADIASHLRECMDARPAAFITVITQGYDGPLVQDGPECLMMTDGRSTGRAKRHIESSKAAHALAPSQPAAVGERADALWEQLLPLMQVEECPPGDPYKDKVAALALIEAALVHRDQVKL